MVAEGEVLWQAPPDRIARLNLTRYLE